MVFALTRLPPRSAHTHALLLYYQDFALKGIVSSAVRMYLDHGVDNFFRLRVVYNLWCRQIDTFILHPPPRQRIERMAFNNETNVGG